MQQMALAKPEQVPPALLQDHPLHQQPRFVEVRGFWLGVWAECASPQIPHVPRNLMESILT